MDAQIKPSKEEYALSMVQRSIANAAIANIAALTDAQIKYEREEYAKDTEHTATPTD